MSRCPDCGREHPDRIECPESSLDTVKRSPEHAQPELISTGTVLEGVYRVGDCVGQGANGSVYVVEHLELGKRFAAKVLRPTGRPDDDAVARLRNEARAASAIDHENIVNVVHLGVTPDHAVYVVMELLQGEDLGAHLRARREAAPATPWLPDGEVRTFASQILRGLDAAHRANIVHRDLKPENVFLARRAGGGEPIAKLVDFGLSKLLGEQGNLRLTRAGEVFGTPLYMSPEQCRSAASVDHRTDLYSFGVMLYEMVTGRAPFEARTIAECLTKHLTEAPTRPSKFRPDVAPGVEAVVLKCLEKAPEARFQSAHEVLDALEAAWPSARPVRPRRGVLGVSPLALLAVVPALAVAAFLGARSRTPSVPEAVEPARAHGLLTSPATVLACPPLEAEGVEAPTGWLGATTAAIVCERARVVLGGKPERTLAPAELLGLPRIQREDFPDDPYGEPGARDRALEAARSAAAWVDGRVVVRPGRFHVSLTVRAPDGRVAGEGQGEGAALYEAVRDAMVPLITSGALPKADALDPEVAEWSRATTVDALLALVDIRIAQRQNGPHHRAECEAWLKRSPTELREAWALHASVCRAQLGLPEPEEAAEVDFSSGPALVATALRGLVSDRVAMPEPRRLFEELERRLAAETTSTGRASLAAAASCLAPPDATRRAQELALLAVGAQPRFTGAFPCEPWFQAVYVSQMSLYARRAVRAWMPWQAESWIIMEMGRPEGLQMSRRAYLLGPCRRGVIGAVLDRAVEAGRQVEMRAAVSALRCDSSSAEYARQSILARIDAAEARFERALAYFQSVLTSRDPSTSISDRVDVSFDGLEISRILGREEAWAELSWEQIYSKDLGVMAFNNPRSSLYFAQVCLRAARYREPCFQRLRDLMAKGAIPNLLPEAPRYIKGVELLAAGKVAEAAAAWRPIVRSGAEVYEFFQHEVADVFDKHGELDLAERLDAPRCKTPEFNGANLAMVRSARRAERLGDHARAAELATKVVTAWSVADADVPAVAEMRALLQRVKPRSGAR